MSRNRINNSSDKSDLVATIQKGVEYLLKKQGIDGTWKDFNLPRGQSDAWTTAYIAQHMLKVSRSIEDPRIHKAVYKAANWLKNHQNTDAGWSYNKLCETDSDSTAHGIILMKALDWQVMKQSYYILFEFQREDGGFATYHSKVEGDAWGRSHPDVTPIVIQALITKFPKKDPRIIRACRYVIKTQGLSGAWPSYWWNTPLYGTLVNIELAIKLNLKIKWSTLLIFLNHFKIPDSEFGKSLLLRIHLLTGRYDLAKRVINSLLKTQREDGGWNPSPILRLTYNTCSNPWSIAYAGPIFSDENGMFTTATVISAIVRVLDWERRI